MIDQKQIERLTHVEDFIDFLQEVHDLREASIQQLHDRPDTTIQQVAGRILQCDDILKMGGWDIIESRRHPR